MERTRKQKNKGDASLLFTNSANNNSYEFAECKINVRKHEIERERERERLSGKMFFKEKQKKKVC